MLDIITSVVPYLAVSVLMYFALGVSYLLTLALILPAAGFLVRTFVVFHDCAHGSLLPSKRANRYVGRFLGLFVLSPFQRWRHDHAIHHATSGDLERRGVGDIITLTVAEYRARPMARSSRLSPDTQSGRDVRARSGSRDDDRAAHRNPVTASAAAPQRARHWM